MNIHHAWLNFSQRSQSCCLGSVEQVCTKYKKFLDFYIGSHREVDQMDFGNLKDSVMCGLVPPLCPDCPR